MYGYIYKTTNLLNGKVYIGKRRGEFVSWYYGSGKILKQALDKYGKENFSVEIIDTAETEQEHIDKEKYWISYYRSICYVYNIADGGEGGDTYSNLSMSDKLRRNALISQNGYFANMTPEQSEELHRRAWVSRRLNGRDKCSEETKKKISSALSGRKLSAEWVQKGVLTRKSRGYTHSVDTRRKISESNRGKKRSSETRKKLSDAGKLRVGNKNGFYGKHHSAETRQRISDASGEGSRNTVWINNNVQNRRVKKFELKEYLENGYEIGRIKWKKK